HQLRKAAPGVDFRAVNERASCRYMKMITPEKLLVSLRELRDEVVVDPEIAAKARGAVERMISIGQSGSGECPCPPRRATCCPAGRPAPTSSSSAPGWPG